MKSEPDELSIDSLAAMGEARWDGVRNYQARNFMRGMADGDSFFFYHSSCPQPGIAGIGQIIKAAYPDPTAVDSRSPYFDAKATPDNNPWSAVNVAHLRTFDHVLELALLKRQAPLADLALVHKGSRLSVMPVTAEQWQHVLHLAR